MGNRTEMQKGDLIYLRGSILGIESHTNQFYKVHLFMKIDVGWLVEVKHYKTKKCNKVHIYVTNRELNQYGYKYEVNN